MAGQILRKVYKFQTSKHFKISCQEKCFISHDLFLFFSHLQKFSISSTKILMTSFLVISSISYVSALPNAPGTTAQPTFCIIHSQNFTLFSILFYAFLLFQFKFFSKCSGSWV